jgi:phosphoribosylamine--glycine ligase
MCGTNVEMEAMNFGAIKQFVLTHGIKLVVVGPEEPLVNGIVDFFENDSETKFVLVVGPSQAGARLEGSKDFAKAFMARHGIPTAAYRTFNGEKLADGEAFLETLQPPYVLKADGLAAGKGVVIPETLAEAKAQLAEMLSGKFGTAGNRVVIEEFLRGIECSVFVATDGTHYKILPAAKDYKRVGEGDTGLNTGGMGAVSPVSFADSRTAAGKEFMRRVEERIVRPTIEGLAAERIPYKGFIFIGLMNVAGDPYVIEYNVRMGDPETEVVFPRITSDVAELMEGIVCGSLDKYELTVSPDCAATVVCVSGGYPGSYKKGLPISGLEAGKGAESDTAKESKTATVKRAATTVFHSGTARTAGGVVTAGGRVVAVTSLAKSMDAALKASYAAIDRISFEGIYYRRDIGSDLK